MEIKNVTVTSIDQNCCVFISKDGRRYITTYNGSPCFSRASHDRLLKLNGVNHGLARNVTSDFYFNGRGQSIKQFLK